MSGDERRIAALHTRRRFTVCAPLPLLRKHSQLIKRRLKAIRDTVQEVKQRRIMAFLLRPFYLAWLLRVNHDLATHALAAMPWHGNVMHHGAGHVGRTHGEPRQGHSYWVCLLMRQSDAAGDDVPSTE